MRDEERDEAANAVEIFVREPHSTPIAAAATAVLCKSFQCSIINFIEPDVVHGEPSCEMSGAIKLAADGGVRVAKRPQFHRKCGNPRREVADLHFRRDFGR